MVLSSNTVKPIGFQLKCDAIHAIAKTDIILAPISVVLSYVHLPCISGYCTLPQVNVEKKDFAFVIEVEYTSAKSISVQLAIFTFYVVN